jgi:hypothetical protein
LSGRSLLNYNRTRASFPVPGRPCRSRRRVRARDPHQPRSASVSPPKHGLKDAARRYAVSLRSVLDPASGRRSWASKGLSRALASEGVARPSPKPMEDRRDPPAVGWGKP